MNKILVTYATLSGSTAEVALAVGEELTHQGNKVDTLPLENVTGLSHYDGVVLGAPMILGWHRAALQFLSKNRQTLQTIPIAIFAIGLSLVWMGESEIDGIPMLVDPKRARLPRSIKHLTLTEKHSKVQNYAAPILKAARPARPVSIAFFGGALDLKRLQLPAKLFITLIIQARPGDYRNWAAIRSWANSLPAPFSSLSGKGAGTMMTGTPVLEKAFIPQETGLKK